jgi:hypothetical protein
VTALRREAWDHTAFLAWQQRQASSRAPLGYEEFHPLRGPERRAARAEWRARARARLPPQLTEEEISRRWRELEERTDAAR